MRDSSLSLQMNLLRFSKEACDIMQNNNNENNISNDNPKSDEIKDSKVNRIYLTREEADKVPTLSAGTGGIYRISIETARYLAVDSHISLMIAEFSRANGIKCTKRNIVFANTLFCATMIILMIMRVVSFKLFICIELIDFLLLVGVDIAVKMALEIIIDGGASARNEIATYLVDKLKGVESFTAEEYKSYKDELLILMGLSKSE